MPSGKLGQSRGGVGDSWGRNRVSRGAVPMSQRARDYPRGGRSPRAPAGRPTVLAYLPGDTTRVRPTRGGAEGAPGRTEEPS